MKRTVVIASLAVLGCAAVVATLALGGGPKLNAIFEAKATSKIFTFNAATGSQFESIPVVQDVDVTTGVSDPIHTTVAPSEIWSVAFGQNERFVEAHPQPEGQYRGYSLIIGINNLTHFEIDMGVENDAGTVDVYRIELLDDGRNQVGCWNYSFELDESRNGTAHFEWDKGPTDGTVVEVNVSLQITDDSDEANLYVSSLSLSWDC
ncbi:MAG: hypothetical protein E7182_01870 [Erysipelotrichaceae bacterium]|nr:hypothetical protein [Erysipelotrichaceae bacterium]